MKRLPFVAVLLFCSFFSRTQDVAMAAPASFSFMSMPQTQTPHHRSKLASAGNWTAFGGIDITVIGYIVYKTATKTVGTFTTVNVTQQANGTALEVVGVVGMLTGLTMILIGSQNNHPHIDSKVSLYSHRPNEIGIACKL